MPVIDGDQTLSLDVAVSSSVVESYSNTMNTSLGISVVDNWFLLQHRCWTMPLRQLQQNTVYWTPQ